MSLLSNGHIFKAKPEDSKNAFYKSVDSFKEIGTGFVGTLRTRADKATDSPYDFFNWLTLLRGRVRLMTFHLPSSKMNFPVHMKLDIIKHLHLRIQRLVLKDKGENLNVS